MSKHAARRSETRHLSEEVIQDTMAKPFIKGFIRHLQWGMSRAVIDGVWRFVMVIWRQTILDKIVVTAYPVTGMKMLGGKFAIGTWA